MNGHTLSSREKAVVPATGVLLGRLLAALFFGLIGLGVCRYTVLTPGESATFALLLKGQSVAGAGIVLAKLFAGFALGATAGCYFSFEIPREHWERARGLTLGAFLFILTTAMFIPVMEGGYLWDDDVEVTANPSLRSASGLWEIWTGGVTQSGKGEGDEGFILKAIRPPLRAMEKRLWGEEFTPVAATDYFPLKSTFLWGQYQLFGLNATGYHVTNILVHALNTVLLWRLFRQLRVPGAWLGALLFGIHPVHAESVAWISEGKNTWSLLFLVLSASSWLRYRESWLDGQRAPARYTLALLLYTASLLCKTSGIMFPFVLLLIAWWRDEILRRENDGWKSLRALLSQAAPFFAVSLVLGLVTIWFQNSRAIGGEVIPIGDFWSRLAGAGLAFWWYLGKAFLPINLTTIYPRWPINPAQAWQIVVAALVPLVGVGLWLGQRRIGRTPFFVYGFFGLMLFPVLGFFKMSYMRLTLVADHFQYLADIAVVALVGALVTLALRHAPKGAAARALGALTALVVLALSAYTWQRAAVHYSEETLWTDALRHNWNSWQSHSHLGAVFYKHFQYDSARENAQNAQTALETAHQHFKKAAELNPVNPEVHNNYALTLQSLGQPVEALEAFRRSLEVDDSIPAIRRNYADALLRQERWVEAREQYRQLLATGVETEAIVLGFGHSLMESGRLEGAALAFQRAVELNPRNERAASTLQWLRAKIAEAKQNDPAAGK